VTTQTATSFCAACGARTASGGEVCEVCGRAVGNGFQEVTPAGEFTSTYSKPALLHGDGAMTGRSHRIAHLGQQLSTAGAVLEVVVIVGAVCGVVSGLVTAFHSEGDLHPYVPLGIAIVVGSIISGVLYWALMRALRLFGDYAAFRVTDGGNLMTGTGSRPGSGPIPKLSSPSMSQEGPQCVTCGRSFANEQKLQLHLLNFHPAASGNPQGC
jgi:hypothetical protein